MSPCILLFLFLSFTHIPIWRDFFLLAIYLSLFVIWLAKISLFLCLINVLFRNKMSYNYDTFITLVTVFIQQITYKCVQCTHTLSICTRCLSFACSLRRSQKLRKFNENAFWHKTKNNNQTTREPVALNCDNNNRNC